ncbi:hypothetical protein GE061_000609 [Apolygus lucorum]|uniref:Uncharacterized protein n=1 Tax=Apolygus lucorum TaxID=248454 RepID=A0A8S9Y6C3_APOLU|nr:hypothetical protein GE061_000609 [Apolygus lucorum]
MDNLSIFHKVKLPFPRLLDYPNKICLWIYCLMYSRLKVRFSLHPQFLAVKMSNKKGFTEEEILELLNSDEEVSEYEPSESEEDESCDSMDDSDRDEQEVIAEQDPPEIPTPDVQNLDAPLSMPQRNTDWYVLSCVTPDEDKEPDLDQQSDDDGDDSPTEGVLSTRKISPKARMSLSLQAKMECLRSFLSALPHMESHYCRKDKKKQYLEPVFQTKTEVFELYQKYASERNTPSATLKTFYEEFDRHNMSIYTPRKDQCDTCVGFKAGTVSQDYYNHHQEAKTLARSEMDSDN